FVRWTEQRNFEAVLDMMADGRLDVKPLISHRFAIDDAEGAYALVGGTAPSLGILLTYPQDEASAPAVRRQTVQLTTNVAVSTSACSCGFIGSGNYATAVLIPAFKLAGARLKVVASSAGVSGLHAGRKFGFEQTTTDTAGVLSDPTVTAVVITTRHDSHAGLVIEALKAGKHVFVEKPLCLTLDELAAIEEAAASSAGRVVVGFNRRFAPQVQRVKQLLAGAGGPKAFVMTVNAGAIPAGHWTQDSEIGGGRIVGEACHFIDLLRFLAGAPITEWRRMDMASATQDTLSLQLGFADGSIGTVHYFANGPKSFPKERLEVFAGGRALQLDNFRKLTGFGWPGFSKMNLWRQDKGQKACAAAFVRTVESGGAAPIPLEELIEVARVTIEVAGG
ncbi:MAG: Gfo/Idh/MocA family oxidoreductase, partial [Rhodocyclaceae bacterium]